MRWHRRFRPEPPDLEGIEKAKSELQMARLIAEHANRSAREHAEILRRNNLGPKIHKALGGN